MEAGMDTGVIVALCVLGAMVAVAIIAAIVSAAAVSSVESRDGEGEKE